MDLTSIVAIWFVGIVFYDMHKGSRFNIVPIIVAVILILIDIFIT